MTQLPVVTSGSAAGVTSATLVDGVKSTVALPFSCWVTCIALPDTDAIRPLTCAWPLAGGAEVVCEVVGELAVELGDVVGLDVFDEPHAATDSAAAPVTARTAARVSRGLREVADIKVSPIVGGGPTIGCTRSSCGWPV